MAKKILIADDEPHIRLLLGRILEELEDEGVEILTAEDGLQTLRLIEQEQPDLVFLDVMMPQLNGFDVCRQVKQQLNLQQIYIIMLTAKGQEIDREQGQVAGADEYVTKPFDPDEMLEKAEAILGLG